VRKFCHLLSAKGGLLLWATLLLWVIRLGLWLVPLRTLRRLLVRLARGPTRLRKADSSWPEQIAWAVATASRYVAKPTCLTQALAAQVMLQRAGCQARLHIGVAKGAGGQLDAHAWTESQSRIVTCGREELSRYTRLSHPEGREL